MRYKMIELNSRYLLCVGENAQSYLLHQLELNQDGVWNKRETKEYKRFEDVIEALMYCELLDEDVICLSDCLNVLKAIHSEIKEARVIEQSYD